MRTEEEIEEAIKILSEYLAVVIDLFNKYGDHIFQVRGHELETMINVIKNDRSPAWIYKNTIGTYNAETVEDDNIHYHSAINAMEWRMKMGENELEDLI